MGPRPNELKVRPVPPSSAPPIEPRGRPSLVAIALLLLTGAAAGYLAGLPADTASRPPAGAAASSVVQQASAAPLAHYDWQEQAIPDGSTRWAIHTAIELDGTIYLLVGNSRNNLSTRSVWNSTDGTQWAKVSTDFGPDVVITDLDAYDGELILSGWVGATPTLWRSEHIGGEAEVGWTTIPLPGDPAALGDLVAEFSVVRTEVNEAGETVVVTDTQVRIDDLVVGHSSDQGVANRLQFDELPEIAVEPSRIWINLLNPGGARSVHYVDVEPTTTLEPVSGRLGMEVGPLRAWSLWTSADGRDFTAITPPAGLNIAPTVMGFGESFVATAPGKGAQFDLWLSPSGAVWERNPWNIPQECGRARPIAASGASVVALSNDFGYVCVTDNGLDWEVRTSPATTVTPRAFITIAPGNRGAFLATVLDPPHHTVLTSADGLQWERVVHETEMTGGSTTIAGNRLLTVARRRGPGLARSWRVWVGEPSSLDR